MVYITLIRLSFKNIFRNRRRSLITISILTLGASGLILIGGFFNDLILRLRESIIHSQSGHLQVAMNGYFDQGTGAPLDYLIADVERTRQIVESDPAVLYTVPRLRMSGMASSSKSNLSALILGVDPTLERRMNSYKNPKSEVPAVEIKAGEDLNDSEPYGAVIGQGLLKTLKLKIGDSLNLTIVRKGGAIDAAIYRIRGSFETSMKDFDDHAVRVTLPTLQRILGTPNQANSLLVVLDDTSHTDRALASLMDRIKVTGLSLEVVPWYEQATYFLQSRDLLLRIQRTIEAILAVIFVFSIANTINMSIHERVREYGTMMAIGNPQGMVFGVITLESAFIGLISAVTGIVVGLGLSLLISVIGISMPPPPQAASGYMAGITPTTAILIKTFFLTFLSALTAAILPAYHASRLRITEALSYV